MYILIFYLCVVVFISQMCNVKLGLYTVWKVSESIGIIKSVLVLVPERQLNDSFNDTFHNYINKHKATLSQK